MAHKIRVAFLGEGELLPAAVVAVLDKNILPPENIFLSEKDKAVHEAVADRGVVFCSDDMNTVVKGEVVVVCAPKKSELSAALSPISGCTRGRIVIAMCPGADCAYVADRVSRGTTILAAQPEMSEDGVLMADLEFAPGFPSYMRGPCADIVGSICELR
ncbi:MAG: hypothetical protein ACI3XZ_05715 [Butyricicoccus sp.]